MDYYEIWFDLRDSSRDLEFAARAHAYLDHLREHDLIEGYRLARRKLGLGPAELGEFRITIEVRDLAQLDRAFGEAARREGQFEELHRAVYESVRGVRFGLYRDFPDPVRRG